LDPANLSTRQPELIWPDHGTNNRSPVEYFYLFFPTMCVAQTLILTSAELTKLGRPWEPHRTDGSARRNEPASRGVA
jgi:hypothetical protein